MAAPVQYLEAMAGPGYPEAEVRSRLISEEAERRASGFLTHPVAATRAIETFLQGLVRR